MRSVRSGSVQAVSALSEDDLAAGPTLADAPLVGDAIWQLEAVRLPSGDKVTDGWIVLEQEPRKDPADG